MRVKFSYAGVSGKSGAGLGDPMEVKCLRNRKSLSK